MKIITLKICKKLKKISMMLTKRFQPDCPLFLFFLFKKKIYISQAKDLYYIDCSWTCLMFLHVSLFLFSSFLIYFYKMFLGTITKMEYLLESSSKWAIALRINLNHFLYPIIFRIEITWQTIDWYRVLFAKTLLTSFVAISECCLPNISYKIIQKGNF